MPLLTVTQNEFVATCRGLIGTPYSHQGRDPLFGLDCLGLPEYAASVHGFLSPQEFTTGYSRFPTRERLLEKGLGARLVLVGTVEPGVQGSLDELLARVEDADLFLLQWSRLPGHLGVAATRAGERTMIHAFQNRSKTESAVMEENLTRFGANIVAAYRLPEVMR